LDIKMTGGCSLQNEVDRYRVCPLSLPLNMLP
jgi:hypothetical protein